MPQSRSPAWTTSTALSVCFLAAAAFAAEPSGAAEHEVARADALTGEVLPVFYVADVRGSVEFYRKLGFTFHHYWDYDVGAPVVTWTAPEPPIYAEMSAGPLTVGIHLEDEAGTGATATRHYFRVDDVEDHRRRLAERGIEVGKFRDLPWMLMFSVRCPDGHLLSFFTPSAEDEPPAP